ncbi:MAG: signal transduction histidine kinase/CheY-like chemotaxis protein [Kiritimatiellia bacterium]|jgi:signal transduction histidine kinase/CheY-like chemotaxis protein
MSQSELDHTMADIALLYELSLAVSTSLDVQTCCESFLSPLMARKNLTYVAVWLCDEQQVCDLVYGVPRVHIDARSMPLDHPILVRAAKGPFAVRRGEPGFDDLCQEARIDGGTYAILPLGDLGVLKLHAQASTAYLDAVALRQLDPVVNKFAASLRACLNHRNMLTSVQAQRALEQRLVHAARLESVGQLAGGVAHDFNNIIAAISAYSELITMQANVPAQIQVYSNRVLTACDRAAALTRQLLAFSRRNHVPLRAIDLNGVIREVAMLLERTVDARIDVRVVTMEGPATVMGDPSRLHSLVLNLAVNAADAQPDGGVIELITRKHITDDNIVLDVVDQGHGMDQDTCARSFDPFFTTKPPGRGTGLGLAAANSTVQAHMGTIEIDSVVDRGTRISVCLPRTDEQVIDELNTQRVAIATGLRVLLVDDDRLSRMAATDLLRQLGCRVTDAGDGVTALSLFDEISFDIVVLDLMMPDLDGAALLRSLRKIDPDVRAIISSGFGHPRLVNDIQSLRPGGFLQKPYRIEALAREIARLMS